LKIESQSREDQQVQLIVEFEPEVYEKYKHQAARKISQESKVPGFRPGKAPYDVIRRMFGDKAIANQAVDILIDKEYPEIIKKADVNPSGPGSLQKVEEKENLKIEILVPLQPEIDLGDYRSIRLDYSPATVSTEEVDKFIDRLRSSYASVEPADRPIQETDLVYLSTSGRLTTPAEGEDPEVIKESPQQVIIESEEQQKEEEWPFPGFVRGLIGLSAGDEKTLTHTYPDDAKDEKLRGKEVEFHVTIQSVKSMKLPELTDEFAQTVGEYDSVLAMRNSISEGLAKNTQEQYDAEYYTRVIDKIRENATLKYPPQLLDHEIEHVYERLERDLARQKLDFEAYLKLRKLTKEALIEQEVKPAAISRLERSLIMDEIAKVEKLELDQKMLEGAISQTVDEMESTGEYQKARKGVTMQKLADAVAYEAASRVMSRQTLDRLKAIATGTIEQAPEQPDEIPEPVAQTTEQVVEQPAQASETEEGEPTPTLPQDEANVSTPVSDETNLDVSNGENISE
jgi:trigger factor